MLRLFFTRLHLFHQVNTSRETRLIFAYFSLYTTYEKAFNQLKFFYIFSGKNDYLTYNLAYFYCSTASTSYGTKTSECIHVSENTLYVQKIWLRFKSIRLRVDEVLN